MPCLLAFIALLAPRVVIVLLWFFSDWFVGMFATPLWPILGFLFLPTTLLWYSAIQHWWAGVWGLWPVVGLIIALVIDTSPSTAKRRTA
jgi:hypothetical protein